MNLNIEDTIIVGMPGAGKSFNMLPPDIWTINIDEHDSDILKSSNLRNMRIDLYEKITDIMSKGY